jgi:hypothetical protein
MIIPNQLKDHLRGPRFSYLGTRDKDFNCDLVRAFASSVTGHDTVKFFIAELTAAQTLDNLRSNKIVTLSVTNVFTSESYQMKGKVLNVGPASGEEMEVIAQYIDEFEDTVLAAGFQKGLVKDNFVYHPALAIEFVVENLFDQSPKVGTGQQVTIA